MKKVTRGVLIIGVLLVMFNGCGKSGSSTGRVNTGNNVDKVLNEQVNAAEQSGQPENTENTEEESTVDSKDVDQIGDSVQEDTDTIPKKDGIDLDLTEMGSDMVYATVYQLMVDPDTYIGKKIKMQGAYNATYCETTKKYYHYCIIKDAAACCAQGMEFVWDNGQHKYPDEYPKDQADVVVSGVFETYREDGDTNLYCRLKDATLEILK